MPVRASAKTTLDVELGVDGFVAPGKPIPVRVTIKADRLIKGTVVAKANDSASQSDTIVPIEVAGGATKDVLLVIVGSMQNLGESPAVRVIVTDGSGELASAEVSATTRPDQEIVGAFPQLLARGKPPDTAKLAVDAGTAHFAAFHTEDLSVPGAIETFDMLAATAADLTVLGSGERREMLGWIARGGRLLVQAEPADLGAFFPAEWRPTAGGRVGAGRGEVGLISSGAWWDRLEPTPTRSMIEDAQVGVQMGGFPLANAIAADAGFQAARVGWLVGFLAIYVLVTGPIAYLVLKRMRRPGLLWGVVPALAALFTVGAAVVGGSQQHTNRAGYAMLVESTPAGSWSFGSIGALAKGGSLRSTLPEGWRPAITGNPFMGNGGTQSNVRSTLTKAGTEVSIATGVGQFELLSGYGPTARPRSYQVVATSADDDTVSGTVKNTSGIALTNVAVFSGYSAASIGTLPAGEEKSFTITRVSTPRNFQNGPMDDPRANIWPEVNGWQGPPQLGGPVNGALWTSYLGDTGSNIFRLGRVVVAGWTREEAAPFPVSGSASGRTAFVQDDVVTPSGILTAGSIRSDVVRAPGNFGGGPNADVVAAFTLASTATPRTSALRLRLRSPGGSTSVDTWNGSAWVTGTYDADGTTLPSSAIQSDRVYVRVHLNQLNGPFQGLVLGEVTP